MMVLRELTSPIVIDQRKLTAYVLAPDAPRGRHKALVFERDLEYTLHNMSISAVVASQPIL